ncbi:MAG: PD-(D/E)XK nuclease family protein [Chloroflexota bacterium]|nr:PD-(D/E)XK nuclease family protein [Chloroflexota bacterium]
MHQAGNATPPRLIVDRLSPDLTRELWRLIREEKRDDVLAPVTVVTPTRYAGLSLRQELGRTGFANVRFMPVAVLSELLGAAALAQQGRQPLTGVLENLAVRQALAQTDGPLRDVSEHPSTQSSVRAAFRQLRNTDDAMRSALASRGGIAGEMARLYDRFRRLTAGGWYDAEDLAEAGAATVNAGAAPGLDDLGLIVFHLPHGLSPGEVRLMESLVGRRRCAVILGITGDVAADESTLDLAARLRGKTASPTAPAAAESDTPLRAGSARLHVAPTAHDELRWVIRQIMREVNESDTPLHRMAILYRTADPYASLIRDELRMAGIPMAGPDREPLANTGAGRTLMGLLELCGSQFPRSEVMAWLSSCPVRNPVVENPAGATASFSPSRWDVVTRKAGIVSGVRQWRDRLDAHAQRLIASADRRETDGETSASRARGMRAEAAAARDIQAFIDKLVGDLDPPADGSPWRKFADWAEDLLDSYLAIDVNGSDSDAAERIRRLLDDFAVADSMNDDATLAAFRQMLAEMMQTPFGHLGPTGQGVFVSSFAGAAGMTSDAVWLVGMIEGAVPPSPRRDPLLTEPDWSAAGGRDRIQMRMAEERYEYLAAVASASRRTLSYPVADAASQRPAYPSRWFLEQASALAGSPVRSGDLAGLSGHDWFTVDASPQQALANADAIALADEADFRRKRLLEWRRDGRAIPDHPYARRGPMASAYRLASQRSLRRLTEYDGNLSGIKEIDSFGIRPDGAPISPTALETWAACPYRYFLGHVLRLGALDAPEEIFSISALDRGTLGHEILERFIRESRQGGHLPAPGQPWGPGDHDQLMRIAAQSFQEAEAHGVTGKRLLWDMAKTEILSDLETFLEADSLLREAIETADVRVETRFGFGGDSTEVIDPDSGIRFRGMIDRMDISSDGKAVLVVDYKTGSADPYKGLDDDPIDQGRRLQLGVYSLAARASFPDATDVSAAYWFSTNRGGFRFAPAAHFNITDESVAKRFREGVASIVDGINGGIFPANPGPPARYGPSNCQYCDFDAVCPTRRADLWERKKSDSVLAGYLQLAEPDREGD